MFSFLKKKAPNQEGQVEQRLVQNQQYSHHILSQPFQIDQKLKDILAQSQRKNEPEKLVKKKQQEAERRHGFKSERIDDIGELAKSSENGQTPQKQEHDIFIEYEVQKNETLDDIACKFAMDKVLIMELNQIENENDAFPKIIVVTASKAQRGIIVNHAHCEEIMMQIERNCANNHQIKSKEQQKIEKQEMQSDSKNIINERSYDAEVLEKQQAYQMSLLTPNGILRGNLIICRYMATFEPNLRDFARLLCDREKDQDGGKQKHHKYAQLDSVHDYQVTIDFNDIVMTDIETRPYNQGSQPQIESILSIFLDSPRISQSIEGGHKCYVKVDFVALEPAKEGSGGTGRTLTNYILEKIQYLTGKVKTSQESILKFTEAYVPPPTQTQVKQFSLVRCDSLVTMGITSNNSFSQLANNPPRLDYYPVMRELASDNASYQQGVTLIMSTKKQKPSFVPPKEPLLSQSLFEQIVERLPCYLQNKDWTLMFNPLRHGFSFDQFLKKTSNIGPHVLVIRDRKNQNIFGAFVTEGWQKRENTYGTGEAFLFSFKRNPEYYPRKYTGIMSYNVHGGESQHVQLCNETGFAVGVDAQYALFIHHTFDKGTTHPTRIMNNNPLTYPCDFKIDTFEIWGLDDSVL